MPSKTSMVSKKSTAGVGWGGPFRQLHISEISAAKEGKALGCLGTLRQLSPALRMKQIFLFVSLVLKYFPNFQSNAVCFENYNTTEECEEERESLP